MESETTTDLWEIIAPILRDQLTGRRSNQYKKRGHRDFPGAGFLSVSHFRAPGPLNSSPLLI